VLAIDSARGLAVVDTGYRCDPMQEPSRIIDIQTGNTVIDLGSAIVHWAEFGPSGTPAGDLVAILDDHGASIFRVSSGEQVGSLLADSTNFFLAMTFSNDGLYLGIGSQTGRAMVVSLESLLNGSSAQESLVQDFIPGVGSTAVVAVGDDLMATSHGNHTIGLWNLRTRAPWAEFSPPTSAPIGVRFAPGDGYLFYDTDSVIRRFPLDDAELLQLARDRVTRQLTPEECARYEVECSAT
jgi:WD40 repeat protein